MLFNSLQFLIFFPIVVTIYFATAPRWRWAWLLASSYYFYMAWKPEYIILILLSTGIDYFAGIRMAGISEKRARRKYLILSLITNLGLLFAFKYFNFFNDSTRALFDAINVFYNVPAFQVLLPVGISFYTFQTLSYSIDVYNGKARAERHLGIFALYVSFWPQLVAGPIERSSHLLPQFRETFDFDYERVRSGLLRMLWGFFKKVVIADQVALFVNTVYNHPADQDGWAILIATYFFAFQIYCDFSGYSDIAIGTAQVMGFNLMENFKRPYFAKSIPEFWHRWHISLSTWFRDYLYVPLGGNRVVKWRWYCNLMITFLVSGLWHGASWTFVIWGALHGAYMIITMKVWGDRGELRVTRGRFLMRLTAFGQMFLTFQLVAFGWIFFRANTLSDAVLLVRQLFSFPWEFGVLVESEYQVNFIITIVMIIVLLVQEVIVKDSTIDKKLLPQSTWVRWSYYTAVTLFILWFGVFTQNQFIYFQF